MTYRPNIFYYKPKYISIFNAEILIHSNAKTLFIKDLGLFL